MKIYKLQIPIGELFKFLNLDNDLYDSFQIPSIDRKVLIKNHINEYVPINFFIKKRGYVRTYQFDGGNICCDEKHKIAQKDNIFKFIKDCEYVIVQGEERKIFSKSERELKDVYDISIDFPHTYITSNGVVSHNTSLALMLAKSLDCDFLYINASEENSVDVVRDKITKFVSTIGFKPWKIVVLDECLEKGTLVHILRFGNEIKIPIEELDENNDLVKSFNIKTNKVEWQPFKLFDKGIKEIWEIYLENNDVVRCTSDHKWFVFNKKNEIEVVKTIDLHKYNYILSPF